MTRKRKPMTKAEQAVLDAALKSFAVYLKEAGGSVRDVIRLCSTPHGKKLARSVARLAKERAKGKP